MSNDQSVDPLGKLGASLEGESAPQSKVGDSDGRPQERTAEATRLLCAAAYLDGVFAQDIVREFVEEEHRAVAIPPGVDIAAVVKHSLAACGQKHKRDVGLAIDVFATIIFVLATRSGWALVVGFLAAWALVFWDLWRSTYYVISRRLNPNDFSASDAPTPRDEATSRRIVELTAAQHGNVVVYSGFSPFAGAGVFAQGWSFVVDLRKQAAGFVDDSHNHRPLRTCELYKRVAEAFSGLNIASLAIRDRLYVSGLDVRDDRTILPDIRSRPVPEVAQEILDAAVNKPTNRVRHYQCVQIQGWGGELVVSFFIRFSREGDRLFCELSRFVLFPLREEFHRYFAAARNLGVRRLVFMASRSFLATPVLSFRSPRVVVGPIGAGRSKSKRAREVEQDLFFDYGAAESALDRARSNEYRRYFQFLDKEKYVKTMDALMLDTIMDVLAEHGIDTEQVVEGKASIVNQSINLTAINSHIENANVGGVGNNIVTRGFERMRSAAGVSSGGAGQATGGP